MLSNHIIYLIFIRFVVPIQWEVAQTSNCPVQESSAMSTNCSFGKFTIIMLVACTNMIISIDDYNFEQLQDSNDVHDYIDVDSESDVDEQEEGII